MEKSKGTKIGIFVALVLAILVIVNTLVSTLISANRAEPFAVMHWIADIIIAALLLIYATVEYKKPHGNMLRTTFVAFAIYILATSIIPSAGLDGTKDIIVRSLSGISAVAVTYVGCRLNRINKNKVLMIFVGILLLASRTFVLVTFPANLFRVLGVYTQPIIWAAIGFAYAARYEEHKAAGLEDK